MTKIEFFEYEQYPERTGWYICEYDKLNAEPTDITGPYDTKTGALRMWRDHRPEPKEPSNVGHEG
jgi:hypothetical protein